ncbi:MAG: protease HtpX [Gammaproteobacteria bacterium]
MKRLVLFLATNAAVLVVISVVLNALGVEQWLYREGVDLDLNALLVFSAVFGMGGSFISLAISKWLAKTTMGVGVIDQAPSVEEQWLLETVQRLAGDAGIGLPEVGVFDSPEPNAFATGMSRNDALVAVSTGLLRRMGKREVEAVLGHEVTHIANGDMVTMGLLQGVLNTFVLFFARIIGYVVDRVLFNNERGAGPAYFAISILAQIFLSVLATLIVMAFSRSREFRADAGGAELAGTENMIAALERLQSVSEPRDLPSSLATLGIGGNAGEGLARLFMSHPPLEERIAALARLSGNAKAASQTP